MTLLFALSDPIAEQIIRSITTANKEIIDSISTISAISEEVSAHASDTYAISEQNIDTVSQVVSLADQLKELANKLHN